MLKYTKKLNQGLALLIALAFGLISIPLGEVMQVKAAGSETVTLAPATILGDGATNDGNTDGTSTTQIENPETIKVTIAEGGNLLDGTVLVDGMPVKDGQVTVEQKDTHDIRFQVAFGSAVGEIFVNSTSCKITDLGEDKLQVTVPDAESYTIKLTEGQSDDLTIMWSYKQEDADKDFYVENGKVELISVERNGETVYDSSTAGENISIDNEGGWVALKRGDDVTIKLIPDYGYQVKSVIVNDVDTLQPQASVSTFLLENIQGNMHLKGMFIKQEDVINNSSDVFGKVKIANGENAASSGNLELNIADDEQASNGVVISDILDNKSAEKVGTVDITLDNVVSKGNGQSGEAGNWTTGITEFNKPIKVSLTLENASLAENEEYVVLRKHADEDIAVINADFNKDTKEIEFETNKFSTYIVAKKTNTTTPEAHIHTYHKERYGYDDTNHWSICDDPNCPDADKGKTDVDAHVMIHTKNGIRCTFCPYEKDGYSGQPTQPLKVEDITNSVLIPSKNLINVKITTVDKALDEIMGISSSEKIQGVNVWLESENISNTVSATEKQLIGKKKGSAELGMYIDLSLYKRVGTNEPAKVTDLNGNLQITVDLPEDIIKADRTYGAIRVHNGEAEKLPVTFDIKNRTATITTNGFSTYAIVYEDKPEDTDDSDTDDNPTGTNVNPTTANVNPTIANIAPTIANVDSTSTDVDPTSTPGPTNGTETTDISESPKTGDSSNIILWASLATVLALGILTFRKKRI
ncbi:MAG: LPXTG cell wall anchor domain-containing protein [Bacteroides sp.]